MVEQRKSFPQAVPSSICVGCDVSIGSLQSHRWRKLLLRAQESSTLQSLEAPSLGARVVSGREAYVVAGEVVDSSLGQHAVVCNSISLCAKPSRFGCMTYTRAQTSSMGECCQR